MKNWQKNLIILIPIVTIYVFATEFFSISPTIASLISLLSIFITTPIANYLVTSTKNTGSAVSTVAAIPVVNEDVDEPISEVSHTEAKASSKTKKFITSFWLITITIVLISVFFWMATHSYEVPSTTTPAVEMLKATHPEYVSNPDAYTVDDENILTSDIPIGQNLWVENVTRTSHNMFYMDISYIRQMDTGDRIVETAKILLPGLTFASNEVIQSCIQNELENTLVKKFITLDTSTYIPTVWIAGQDVAKALVERGFGNPSESFLFNRHVNCGYDYTSKQCPAYIEKRTQISADDFNYFAANPRKELIESYELAKLNELGSHGACATR